MSNQIEIKIDARRLTPDKFLEGAKEFFSLVEGVARNVTNAVPIEWAVQVDKGSAIVRMRIEKPNPIAERSLDTVCQGLRALRNGVKTIPNGFTRNEVSSARRLAKLIDDNVQFVSVQNGGAPEDLPKNIVEIADRILAGQPQIAFGSVEGEIVSLSARHSYSCTIYDPIQRREVTCWLQGSETQKDAVAGYTKRVLASGLIHYAKEGHAVSVTVDRIRIFPPDSELPTVEEIQAIYQLYK